MTGEGSNGEKRTFVNRVAWDENWIAAFRSIIAFVLVILASVFGWIGVSASNKLDKLSADVGGLQTGVAVLNLQFNQYGKDIHRLDRRQDGLDDRVTVLERDVSNMGSHR